MGKYHAGLSRDIVTKIDLRHIFFKGINMPGSIQVTNTRMADELYRMRKGKIKSEADSVYLLEQPKPTQYCSEKSSGRIVMKTE